MQIGTAYSKGGKYDIYSFIYRSDHLWHLEKLRTADPGLLSPVSYTHLTLPTIA